MTKMRSAKLAMVAVVLVAFAVAAQAQAPTVTFPRNGDEIGPATDVIGNLGHKGLIVIITDVYNTGEDAAARSVPGIRHYTEANGSFSFHVAAPRHQQGQTGSLVYKIRVFELKSPGNRGPETVITVHSTD